MNWIAILVAAVVTFLIGWVWYGMIFKKMWMAETGITDENSKGANVPVIMGLTFVFAFMTAFFMYNFVWHADDLASHNAGHGAAHGLIVSVFLALPFIGMNALHELKSWKYVLINVGYWAVSLAAMGAILNVWR